ncbi:MAG: prepilin-type N-terminal cleavage/methylation domain-containing protein [Thermodesulfovibrionales bacterium]|nr:prepilin-type N-terminal cleavage/methylation domain-containing protein [Thermodesulfovibrionales bacterium]
MNINKGSRASGFTLVEIVIAITLSAVIFAILLSAMRLAERSEEKGTEREEVSQRMRIVTDRLTWLIRGAYPYAVKIGEDTAVYFSGTDSALGFVTTSVDKYSGMPEDEAGLKWVELTAGAEGLKIREGIYFLEKNIEAGSGREYIFDPDVKGISFEYLEIADTGEGNWVLSWEPKKKDRLPSAVRVNVALDYKGKRFELPGFIVRIRAQ